LTITAARSSLNSEELEESEPEVIMEITYGKEHYDKDGVRRARLVKDDYYYYLQIGLIYKDNPDFHTERLLTFNEEELPVIKQLLDKLGEQ